MTERTPAIEALADNLKEQITAYRQMNVLEKEKQQALVDNNTPKLDALVAQEEQVIHSLRRLENERAAWAASFVAAQGEDGQNKEESLGLALKDLAAEYPLLEELGDQLRKELEDLEFVNALNSQLIGSQLSYVNFTLQHIMGDKRPLYGSPGTLVQNTGGPTSGRSSLGLIDRNV